MDCASSMHWFRSDAHLGLWGGTFHMNSMRQIYVSVLCSYACFLMSMRYVPDDLASNLTGSIYAAVCLDVFCCGRPEVFTSTHCQARCMSTELSETESVIATSDVELSLLDPTTEMSFTSPS
jgi:hypothetical protein